MRREENYGWLYGIVAGSCVAAMQIGVGMLQMDRDYAILLGAAIYLVTLLCTGSLEEGDLLALPGGKKLAPRLARWGLL